jgi:hypothetical protein
MTMNDLIIETSQGVMKVDAWGQSKHIKIEMPGEENIRLSDWQIDRVIEAISKRSAASVPLIIDSLFFIGFQKDGAHVRYTCGPHRRSELILSENDIQQFYNVLKSVEGNRLVADDFEPSELEGMGLIEPSIDRHDMTDDDWLPAHPGLKLPVFIPHHRIWLRRLYTMHHITDKEQQALWDEVLTVRMTSPFDVDTSNPRLDVMVKRLERRGAFFVYTGKEYRDLSIQRERIVKPE